MCVSAAGAACALPLLCRSLGTARALKLHSSLAEAAAQR